MSRSTIRFIIFLATLSLIGIIVVQIFWVNTAFDIQEQQIKLQEKQFNQQQKQFNERVAIALTDVVEQILKINNDPAKLYDAVEQQSSNFFTVRINDTLHPFLLESLLKREFESRNINEDFEYGIYDCFTDSIVYGNFVSLSETNALPDDNPSESPQPRSWDRDGHYFSIHFPNMESFSIEKLEPRLGSWVFSTVIIMIILIFFAYTIFVILKQKRLSEVKTDFINNMTHELKTPISTIGISSDVLLKNDITKDPERIKQYARIIKNENQRLENQVERVLQLATLDKEKIELKKSIIDIHEVIKDSVENIRLSIDNKQGKLIYDLNAEKHLIEGDKVHITNIIYNLLDNASKYSITSPLITISTWNKRQNIYISIEDNGIGMDKEAQKHIFDKFYRVPTGNVHDVKGFGLGLYYVKVMIEEHHGEITVESTKGEGSRFIISLPIKN